MKDKDYINDYLWKSVQRIDNYYSDTNNKSNFLLVFNIFVLGSIILKFNNIINGFPTEKIKGAAIVILGIIALGNFLSIYYIFKTTVPFLKSGNKDGEYSSIVFFKSIAEKERDTYLKTIDTITQEELHEDLAKQIHVTSNGLKKKMENLKYAFNITLWGVIFPLLLISFFLLFNSLI